MYTVTCQTENEFDSLFDATVDVETDFPAWLRLALRVDPRATGFGVTTTLILQNLRSTPYIRLEYDSRQIDMSLDYAVHCL